MYRHRIFLVISVFAVRRWRLGSSSNSSQCAFLKSCEHPVNVHIKHSPENFQKTSGTFPEIIRKMSGKFPNIFRNNFGTFPANFRKNIFRGVFHLGWLFAISFFSEEASGAIFAHFCLVVPECSVNFPCEARSKNPSPKKPIRNNNRSYPRHCKPPNESWVACK